MINLKKVIKACGLSLFTLGFVLFNISFFWANYTLKEHIIDKSISDESRKSLFLENAAYMLNQTYSSNFVFIKNIHQVIDNVNEQLSKRYSITTQEVKDIVSHSSNKYSFEVIDQLYSNNNKVDSFKQKAIKDYSGHLVGKSVTIDQLNSVVYTINVYILPSQVGFDSYRAKDLIYALTKASAISPIKNNPILFMVLTIGLCAIGSMLYILPKLKSQSGIKNNNIFFNAMKNTGWMGILTGTWLIVFYILLYFFPEYMTNWIIMVDPISLALNGNEAGRFFLYGFLYTLCILVMGIRMIILYRHSKYQIFRTLSVMFFQTAFAFLIPEILIRLNQPYFDFKNIWPLDYDFFFDSELDKLVDNGTIGLFMLGWGIALIILGVPLFVYFFGKRWYCSWVCGCGGLAETLGDPYRQLSNKSLKAWKIERWMIHGVLVFAVIMTMAVLYTYFSGSSNFIFVDSYTLRSVYGSFIGAGFAGVVGTGFYPLMGNRVWCRFGCPLAAYLGLVQRFKSRFRITTNGGQCISCGNCSTYCEMGIDVRWYAQRGQNIVRSSCVGCGICSSVCPRGVLNLETKDENGRFGKPILIGNNNIELDQ